MILFLWYGILIVIFIYCLKTREGFSQGVQFIRIVNASQPVPNYIQIRELMVYDRNGNNVALGKKTSSSGEWGGLGPEKAVDNNLTEWWSFFHSTHPPKSSDFWEVDLGKEHILARIEYFNRNDCCQNRIIGCSMLLLNKDKEIVDKFDFKTDKKIQTFLLSSNENPAIRDRARWL